MNALDEFDERIMAHSFEGIAARALSRKSQDESGYFDDEDTETVLMDAACVEGAIRAEGYRIVKLESFGSVWDDHLPGDVRRPVFAIEDEL